MLHLGQFTASSKYKKEHLHLVFNFRFNLKMMILQVSISIENFILFSGAIQIYTICNLLASLNSNLLLLVALGERVIVFFFLSL